MLKTLLAATTALTLMSGVSFAETSYSNTTRTTGVSTPLGDVGVSETTHRTGDHDGLVTEKEKIVTKDSDRDHDRAIVRPDFDHDRAMTTQKEKTVSKDTSVSPNGDVSRKKTETTTIR